MYETAGADVGGAMLGVASSSVELLLHFLNVENCVHQSFQDPAWRNSPSRLPQTYHSSTIDL
jgi:hypothetical protein